MDDTRCQRWHSRHGGGTSWSRGYDRSLANGRLANRDPVIQRDQERVGISEGSKTELRVRGVWEPTESMMGLTIFRLRQSWQGKRKINKKPEGGYTKESGDSRTNVPVLFLHWSAGSVGACADRSYGLTGKTATIRRDIIPTVAKERHAVEPRSAAEPRTTYSSLYWSRPLTLQFEIRHGC